MPHSNAPTLSKSPIRNVKRKRARQWNFVHSIIRKSHTARVGKELIALSAASKKTDGELAGVESAYDRHQSISQSATVLPF